jgi:hypothetical protein
MSDITERLRALAKASPTSTNGRRATEAADEIERLRAREAALVDLVERLADDIDDWLICFAPGDIDPDAEGVAESRAHVAEAREAIRDRAS